jgi:hypothetical protein
MLEVLYQRQYGSPFVVVGFAYHFLEPQAHFMHFFSYILKQFIENLVLWHEQTAEVVNTHERFILAKISVCIAPEGLQE